MAIATTTALLIGAGIAGGTSLAAAKMQSNAAQNAAQTQTNAANTALGLQGQMYQQQQQNLAPYMQTGYAAGQNLQNFLRGPGAVGATTIPGSARFLGIPTGPQAGVSPGTLGGYPDLYRPSGGVAPMPTAPQYTTLGSFLGGQPWTVPGARPVGQ